MCCHPPNALALCLAIPRMSSSYVLPSLPRLLELLRYIAENVKLRENSYLTLHMLEGNSLPEAALREAVRGSAIRIK